jgi:hypothetical protein
VAKVAGRGAVQTGCGGSSTPPPTGEKEKTEADKIRSDAAHIHQCPSTTLVVKMEEDDEPPRLPRPKFAPGDYIDDA